MVVCELFSFAQECDIPNWLALIIEAIFGFVIVVSFFIYQKRKADKRTRTATKRITVHLIDLKKSQDDLRKSINDYYGDTIDRDKLVYSLESVKHSSESLEMMLILYSNSIDEHILSKIEFLCGFIKIMKLSGEKKIFDLTLCNMIDDKWDDCIESLRDFDPKTYKITEEGKKQYDANAGERMKEFTKVHSEGNTEKEIDSQNYSIQNEPIVKDGITTYPDGTKVDSHGTIL